MTSGSSSGRARFRRQALAARRTAASGTAGLAALTAAWAAHATWSVALVLAWDVTAAAYLVRVWSDVGRLDGARAQRVAASEADSRASAEALLLSASVASLVAVGFVLAEAGRAGAGHRGVLTALAVVSVLLAWAEWFTRSSR